MKLFPFIISALILLSCNTSNSQSLLDYRWKKRIVLLVDQDKDTDTLQSQLKRFLPFEHELEERDMLIFVVSGKHVYNAKGTPMQLDIPKILEGNFQGILLIGKDGGVKLEKSFEVAPSVIFDLVDSMPMRKSEKTSSRKH
ncbi:MAG: DUF4174 domain-containing protein [Saonia sp.]